MGEQPSGRDALVDNVRRNRCLDQRFAVITDPLASDVAFNREHARRVVELFADILANTLEGAAALAVAIVGFVMDQGARELWRQCGAPRFLLCFGRNGRCLQCLKLSLNRRDIGIDQVVQQAGLLRI